MISNRIVITSILFFSLTFCGYAQPDSCHFDQSIADLMNQVSRSNIDNHIRILSDAGGHETRVSYTEGNEWSVHYIKETFESFPGLTSVEFDTFYIAGSPAPYDTIPLVNVVATLLGSGGESQYYVVGGHLDATGNLDGSLNWDTDWPTAKAQGADDNASGVAATMEIARILSDPANTFNSHKTIKFVAFGAEERHPAYNNNNHKGSQHFVHNAFVRSDHILGAYIVDMIGYNETGNDYFNIVSNTDSRDLGRRVLQTRSAYGIDIGGNMEPFPDPTYSDHDQFWIYRYPAILIIENAPPWQNNPPWYGRNPYYHRESDLPGTINISQVQKIAQLILGSVACLSNVVTGIESPETAALPGSFRLLESYPNPFNPGTNIRYQLSKSGTVTLKIFDVNGREVTQLVNQKQSAGDHAIYWTAVDDLGNDLSSGLYIISLTVGQEQQTQKIALIR